MRKVFLSTLFIAALAIAIVAGALNYSSVSAAADPTGASSSLDGSYGKGPKGEVSNEALAEALGISVADLEAAQQKARDAGLAQAVEQGLITQAQADEIAAKGNAAPLGGRWRGWLSEKGIDFQALLAEALDISVEELQAARQSVFFAQIDQAVTDGKLTAEQAELAKGRYALSNSAGYQTSMQSAYAAAVEQALDAGVITQAQAEQLLANAPSFSGRGHGGPGGGPGGGRGGHGGGPGGGRGERPAAAPGATTP